MKQLVGSTDACGRGRPGFSPLHCGARNAGPWKDEHRVMVLLEKPKTVCCFHGLNAGNKWWLLSPWDVLICSQLPLRDSRPLLGEARIGWAYTTSPRNRCRYTNQSLDNKQAKLAPTTNVLRDIREHRFVSPAQMLRSIFII